MPSIGIIDDRSNVRTTMRRAMEARLPEQWEVADSFPLDNLDDYPSWLGENEAVALVVDQRLREQANSAGRVSNHEGHEIVDFLRQRMPTLPIFMVTVYPDEESLDERQGKVEAVMSRNDFFSHSGDITERIVRSGQKFLDTNEVELSELSQLSQKIAMGEATREDLQRVSAIQEKLQLASGSVDLQSRAEWLTEVQRQFGELADLRHEIQELLQRKATGADVEEN